MRASSKRFVSLLASLAFFAGAVIVFVAFLKPSYTEVNELRGELAAKRAAFESELKIVEEASKVIGTYQNFGTQEQMISFALPTEPEYPTLVNQLQGLAQVSGVGLQGLSLQSLPKAESQKTGGTAPPPEEISATLTVNGPYEAFKNFIRNLETNLRVLDIVSFTVTAPQGASQNYAYTVVVRAYYQSL